MSVRQFHDFATMSIAVRNKVVSDPSEVSLKRLWKNAGMKNCESFYLRTRRDEGGPAT